MKEELASLPAPERRSITTREAVAEMADVIEKLRGRGYTIDEVAQLLTQRGLELAPSTLRSYLRGGTRRAKRTKKQP